MLCPAIFVLDATEISRGGVAAEVRSSQNSSLLCTPSIHLTTCTYVLRTTAHIGRNHPLLGNFW